MDLRDEVIDASAEEGARLVALALLARADEAAERFRGQEDEEALHDFRVGLRRLRSTVRAFRPWLSGGVSRKLERRIARLARATNDARDAEVQLAWLRASRAELPGGQRAGVDALVAELEGRRSGPDPERLITRYRKVSGKLAQRLGTYQRQVHTAGVRASSFGGVLAAALRGDLAELRQGLDAVKGSLDQAGIHAARIAGKRLRYVLEPLAGNRHADAAAAVKRLKRLQDLLGDLHDAHVLAGELRRAYVAAAAARAGSIFDATAQDGAQGADLRSAAARGPRGALLALTRLASRRREERYAQLRREWQPAGLEALGTEVDAVAIALEARAGAAHQQERVYLLTGLPARVADGEVTEIAMGWLPGGRVQERLRRVRGAAGEQLWRGLDASPSAEERTTAEVFAALWPLTEGRRLEKVQRRVEEDGRSWLIEELGGPSRRVLARVSVSVDDPGPPALPAWLATCLVREVTSDPAFEDAHLATAALPERSPAAHG